MTEQERKYYEEIPKNDFEAPYLEDILDGKLKIFEVPPKYRTGSAFVYAIRQARDPKEPWHLNMEMKLIEHVLLSDIVETCRDGDPRCTDIYGLYQSYFEGAYMKRSNKIERPGQAHWVYLNFSNTESTPPDFTSLILHLIPKKSLKPKGRRFSKVWEHDEIIMYWGNDHFTRGSSVSFPKDNRCRSLSELQGLYDIWWRHFPSFFEEDIKAMALGMLKSGKYTMEAIADISGLALEEVEQLRAGRGV